MLFWMLQGNLISKNITLIHKNTYANAYFCNGFVLRNYRNWPKDQNGNHQKEYTKNGKRIIDYFIHGCSGVNCFCCSENNMLLCDEFKCVFISISN